MSMIERDDLLRLKEEERSVAATEAIRAVKKDIAALGLGCEILTYGKVLPVYEVRLFDGEELVARGTGKGDGVYCEAGGYFEAIEHLYGVAYLPGPGEMARRKISELAEQKNGEGYYPFELMKTFADQEVYCSEYVGYEDGELKLDMPAFLWSPGVCEREEYVCEEGNFELYEYLLKYGSNSGVASGMTAEDAVLHGINEGIERDGYGRMLYRYCFCENEKYLPVIDKRTLPSELKRWIDQVEDELEDECLLINATSDIGVPVIGAIFRKYHREVEIPSPGFGCSLYPEIAIRRAVSEAVQIMNGADFYPKERKDSWMNDLERAGHIAGYERCVRFDLSRFEEGDGFQFVPYSELLDNGICLKEGLSVREQINFLVEHLKNFDIHVFVNELKKLKHGVVIMSTQLIGMSLFFLTSNGMLIPPMGRTIGE